MIELEFLALGILIALCVIAYRLKQGNDLAAKSEQHLAALRKSDRAGLAESPLPPPLRLNPEDIEQPVRESLRS